MQRSGVVLLSIACILVLGSSAWCAEIHDVAAKGDAAKVKSLIQKSPSLLNLADKGGATPLHHAVAKNQKAVVLCLIEHKANVNARKKDGVTPLHIASSLGYKEVVEILLAAKADKSAVDKKGRTPLVLARNGKHQAVVDLLQGKPALSITPLPDESVPDAAVSPENNLDLLTRSLVADLTAGSYANIISHFDQNLKTALPEPKLREAYAVVTAQFGPFKKLINIQSAKVQGMDVVCATCEFEKASVDIQIAYNTARQVVGIHMVKSQAR